MKIDSSRFKATPSPFGTLKGLLQKALRRRDGPPTFANHVDGHKVGLEVAAGVVRTLARVLKTQDGESIAYASSVEISQRLNVDA